MSTTEDTNYSDDDQSQELSTSLSQGSQESQHSQEQQDEVPPGGENIRFEESIYPTSWSHFRAKKGKLAKFGQSVQLYGYNDQGESVYIAFPMSDIYVIKFYNEIDEDAKEDIVEILNPSWSSQSTLNSSVLTLGEPTLFSDPSWSQRDENITTWEKILKNPRGPLASFWYSKGIKPYVPLKISGLKPLFTEEDSRLTFTDHEYTGENAIFVKNAHSGPRISNDLERAPARERSPSGDLESERHDGSRPHSGDLDDKIPPNYTGKTIFWDIEVYAKDQFPSPDEENHIVFMISIIVQLPRNDVSRSPRSVENPDLTRYGYLLHLLDIPDLEVPEGLEEVRQIKYANELDLILGFFEIWSQENIDRAVNFNGELFDTPFLLRKLDRYGIEHLPPLGKIRNIHNQMRTNTVLSFGGFEEVEALNTPGVEQIDLLPYFRRFYPSLPNHKLNTVSKFVLRGEGKAELEISTMMRSFESRDPEKLLKVAEYSLKDSILLSDVWVEDNILSKIYSICNNTRMPIERIIYGSNDEIVEGLKYSVDPATAILTNTWRRFHPGGGKFCRTPKKSQVKNIFIRTSNADIILPAIPGVYRDLRVVDYSSVYIDSLLRSEDYLYQNIGRKLEQMNAPSLLVFDTYQNLLQLDTTNDIYGSQFATCKGIDTNIVVEYIANFAQQIGQKNIVEINKVEIKYANILRKSLHKSSSHKIKYNITQKYPRYIVITPSSFIFTTLSEEDIISNTSLRDISPDNIYEKKGLSSICRPKFEAARKVIDRQIRYFYKEEPKLIKPPKTYNVPDLVITENIKNQNTYTEGKDKYMLSQQYRELTGVDILTWVTISYIMLKRGPKIILDSSDINKINPKKINIAYYNTKIDKILKTLEKLVS